MIKFIVIPYASKRDTNGNTYHAFKVVNTANRRETGLLVQDTDGAGFRSFVLDRAGIKSSDVYFMLPQEVSKMSFRGMTKGALYANTAKGEAALKEVQA